MPPGTSYTGYSVSYNSAGKPQVPLPDKFLCRICEKLKRPPQFSTKELNTYRSERSAGRKIDKITARLRCRGCSGEPATELQCNGPCSEVKPLDEFSKNQRIQSEQAWCITCTQWTEANEPGVVPDAPPNTILSPDEEQRVDGAQGTSDSVYGYEECDGETEDSDDEDFIPGPTYGAMTSMSLSSAEIYNIPGSGGEFSTGSSVWDGESDSRTLQPRGVENSSASNATASRNNPFGTNSEYSGEGAILEPSKTATAPSFNAWDAKGKKHDRYPTPSTSENRSNTAGKSSHKNSASQVADPGRTRGGWAKVPSARTPRPSFPVMRRPVQQERYEDEDWDSPNEI